MIDWVNIVVAAVCSIVGAFGGGSLLYLKQTKREKDISNELREADEWEKLYREKEQKCDAKDAKIDELRKHINSLQEERIRLIAENSREKQELAGQVSQLRTEMIECNWYRCEVCGCKNRRPPRELEIGDDEGVAK